MKVSEFRTGLRELQAALRSWGVAKQAGELDGLMTALEEFDDLTFADLAKRVRAINAKPKTNAHKKPNLDVVEKYVALLMDAAFSSEAFDRAVEQILADKKQVKSPELEELARRFGGSVPAKPTRSAIAKFLRTRRLDMRRQDGLGATIDRMFGRAS